MNCILVSYLLVNAWTDWRRKEIDIIYTVLFVFAGVIYKHLMAGSYYWSGMIPGMILLLISFVWKQHVGTGDGIVVAAFGWMGGLAQVCDVLVGGFILAAAMGIIVCIFKKRRNIELPFVPFFLGSYLLELWI